MPTVTEDKKVSDMTIRELKALIKDIVHELIDLEEMEATIEVLRSKELMAQIKEAESSIKKGRSEDFIPWGKVKRNV